MGQGFEIPDKREGDESDSDGDGRGSNSSLSTQYRRGSDEGPEHVAAISHSRRSSASARVPGHEYERLWQRWKPVFAQFSGAFPRDSPYRFSLGLEGDGCESSPL